MPLPNNFQSLYSSFFLFSACLVIISNYFFILWSCYYYFLIFLVVILAFNDGFISPALLLASVLTPLFSCVPPEGHSLCICWTPDLCFLPFISIVTLNSWFIHISADLESVPHAVAPAMNIFLLLILMWSLLLIGLVLVYFSLISTRVLYALGARSTSLCFLLWDPNSWSWGLTLGILNIYVT